MWNGRLHVAFAEPSLCRLHSLRAPHPMLSIWLHIANKAHCCSYRYIVPFWKALLRVGDRAGSWGFQRLHSMSVVFPLYRHSIFIYLMGVRLVWFARDCVQSVERDERAAWVCGEFPLSLLPWSSNSASIFSLLFLSEAINDSCWNRRLITQV